MQALLVRRFDTVICWESKNLRESVIDLPRLIELTVREDITSYGCGHSGADLFVCTKCYERLTRFEKARRMVGRYQGEICSICQPLETINKRKVKRQRANQLVVLVENVAHAPEQSATTKRVSTAKIFKVYRHIG